MAIAHMDCRVTPSPKSGNIYKWSSVDNFSLTLREGIALFISNTHFVGISESGIGGTIYKVKNVPFDVKFTYIGNIQCAFGNLYKELS